MSSRRKKASSTGAVTEVLLAESHFLGIFPFPTWPVSVAIYGVSFVLLAYAAIAAYKVRLYSYYEFGPLIHEFDPWFNYRATEYMAEHGWTAFFHWFDYMSWYPLGRPVGTTIYPGLQITAVAIHRALAAMDVPLTLTQVCVLIPAWFGAVATLLLAAMSYEATGSMTVAAVAAYTFSIVPAHTMRSMAGEFDNECIAVSAMLLTFYTWMRAVRSPRSWPIGVLAGLAYGYMVAAWGGYIFVLNMVALHAGVSAVVDWARGTYNHGLLRAYTLFFVVGTAIATRVPPVSMAPFKSLEQLSALLVLVFLWGLEVAERMRARAGVEAIHSMQTLRIRARVFFSIAAMGLAVAAALAPTGYFGPISSRVRALFVAHTRTGNPLVDSVAEHRPGNFNTYIRYLHATLPVWIVGTLTMPFMPAHNVSAMLFLALYSSTAWYFCARMIRLIILAGPVACFSTAAVVGLLLDWYLARCCWDAEGISADVIEAGDEALAPSRTTSGKGEEAAPSSASTNAPQTAKKDRKTKEAAAAAAARTSRHAPAIVIGFRRLLRVSAWPRFPWVTILFLGLVPIALMPVVFSFASESLSMSIAFANPRIVYPARTNQGESVIVQDYIKSYEWLKSNTPASARVLAWWDYGYQITGVANRTTLADGNTWNHEHIATIGKMLTSPIDEAHTLVRHMADYVLIWAGKGGGDLMKSPHMARIGNSVYRDICPDDPLCKHFGFAGGDIGRPTESMRRSLLYHLHENGNRGVTVDPALFQGVYTSMYGLVRIYKVMNVSEESKAWLADPANRVCNPPGSWMCPGQYPPAKPIQDMLAKRIDFGQLEDFNRRGKDDAYYKAYMNRARS